MLRQGFSNVFAVICQTGMCLRCDASRTFCIQCRMGNYVGATTCLSEFLARNYEAADEDYFNHIV